jgi:gelsolin
LKQANPDEKARANKFAEKICTEGTVTVLDQGAGDEADSAFWAYLKEGEISEAEEDDHIVDEFTPLHFKLPEGDDDLDEAEQVGKGEKVKIGFTSQCKISKDLLDETDVFLLDAGRELFLWIGKNAYRSERLGAFAKADRYCQADLRSVDLPLFGI